MNKLVILISLWFLTGSCCTKVACGNDGYRPTIIINFKNLDIQDIEQQTIYILNSNTDQLVDSVNYNRAAILSINEWMIEGKSYDIRNFVYIIKTKSSRDTISNIYYEQYIEKIKCNKCAFFFDSYDEDVAFRNFKFQHRGTVFHREDTLIINK